MRSALIVLEGCRAALLPWLGQDTSARLLARAVYGRAAVVAGNALHWEDALCRPSAGYKNAGGHARTLVSLPGKWCAIVAAAGETAAFALIREWHQNLSQDHARLTCYQVCGRINLADAIHPLKGEYDLAADGNLAADQSRITALRHHRN